MIMHYYLAIITMQLKHYQAPHHVNHHDVKQSLFVIL